jgi:hypothetical protein
LCYVTAAIPLPEVASASKLDNEMSQPYDIAAYYWPAYHDDPRWREFMPDGEGEWEIIRRAKPKFPGHRQPRIPSWGYLDESDPAVMEMKIEAAVKHGVNVFIFDWYWYDNSPFLEEAFNRGFAKARNNEKMKFYVMWANHDATTLWDIERSHRREVIWPGAVDRATFDRATQRLIDRFFGHPSYYRINDCPVFSIYELGTLIAGLGGIDATRAALEDFRARVRAAGFPDLHLQGILWESIPASLSMVPGDRTQTQDATVRLLGLDSLTSYQWCHYLEPKGPYEAWGRKAVALWAKWAEEFSIPFFPHVAIGWDSNSRVVERREIITDGSPQLFGEFLRQALQFVDEHKTVPRLVTVNSWNEWSEGSYLEPDTVHGNAYLEEVKDAVLGKEVALHSS